MLTRRSLVAAAASGVVALALTACSTGPTSEAAADPATSSSSAVDKDAFPTTVKHAFGETTISAEPKRVATVGWNDADVVVSLGVIPVGATKITWGGNANGSTDWFDAAVTKLDADAQIARYDDTAGIPVEEIAAAKPDLILGVNSGITKEDYDKLSKIAPTVAYPGQAWGTSWEQSVELVGQALGRTELATKVAADTNKAIDDAIAKYPQIKRKSAAWAWFTPTDLSVVSLYTSQDLRPQILRRFGMVDAPTVAALSKGNTQFSANLSAEKSSTLAADALIFYVEKPEEVDTLKKHPLLGQIPALKTNHYVASADNAVALTMSSPSPLSMPVALEKFLPKIASAVDGTPAQ
ncbi:iron ABC transporter substrate-binding protein [Knoellia flava TL1]|uniref:ABC transporter substrate-binding protein n=2 Tax=Knoellia flava TaxID=913969 RepID=A0A8H9FS24_9MICO|nr:iron-siderophore ABC transporter substrate-binding protein [Knoellia flava]KGN35293.1 iron ABC transporter substrate-binding protein [Knoellia flava TL1]GGB77745.1 ABC transporter substrate-binding protein [Knoellia flava]